MDDVLERTVTINPDGSTLIVEKRLTYNGEPFTRKIKLGSKKKKIGLICKAMKWASPGFCDGGANGYLTWKHCTQEEVEDIKEKTGIECYLTPSERLVVPYFVG